LSALPFHISVLPWSDPEVVERVKRELGMKAQHRDIDEADGAYVLREPRRAYTGVFGIESDALRPKNTIPWARNPVIPET
jgi:hypothetical protein